MKTRNYIAKILSMLMIFTVILGSAGMVFAADNTITLITDSKAAADKLHSYNLMNGVGTLSDGTPDYALDETLTREEAVTMLIRLLGKEQDALTGTHTHPFTDVSSWAQPYIGYAYENKLTFGTSETTFSGSDSVSATEYLTLVLRAMGYKDNVDFKWNAAWDKASEIGMIKSGDYSSKNNDAFLRSDAAIISANAIEFPGKDNAPSIVSAIAKTEESSNKASLTLLSKEEAYAFNEAAAELLSTYRTKDGLCKATFSQEYYDIWAELIQESDFDMNNADDYKAFTTWNPYKLRVNGEYVEAIKAFATKTTVPHYWGLDACDLKKNWSSFADTLVSFTGDSYLNFLKARFAWSYETLGYISFFENDRNAYTKSTIYKIAIVPIYDALNDSYYIYQFEVSD